MSPERWRQVEELYHATLENEPRQRGAFLVQACGGDEELRREVESLLAQSGSRTDALDRPAWVGAPDLLDSGTVMRLAPGAQFGPYRIEALLGQGGMGVVYRALDTKLNRPVAIKFLSGDLRDAAARRRFQREAQMASSLNHPHILTVHDAGEIDGQQYLVTEFVDGGALQDWAQTETRTWRQVVELLVGVADGLAAAHAAGIMHRDIKPANILVAKNGYAKLADFGLAKLEEPPAPQGAAPTVAEGPTRTGMIVGTIPYMSPEQASGKPLDARSDIFSFGVVLYEMLAARRPFEGSTDLETLQAVLHATPHPVAEEVPLALRMAVEKALEKAPAERYQTMRDLVVDLKRAQRPTTAETTLPPAPPRPSQRRWGLLAGVTGALLVVALGILWRLWQTDYFWQNPLAGARTQRLTDFEGDEIDAAISPDGKFTAFLSDRDGPLDAWAGPIGSGGFTNLTKGQVPNLGFGDVRRVGFSGDGAHVWISEGVTPQQYVTYLAPAVGGAPHPYLKALGPDWSPDGSRIVYFKPEPGDPIFIADRNGSNPKQIFIEKPGIHCHPLTWSPDGQFIYFIKGTPATEETDIWRIAANTSGAPALAERITYHNARVLFPAWLDERTLIYSATAEDGSGQWLYSLDVERRIPHRVSSGITELYRSVAVSVTRPRRLVASVGNPSASLWTVPISDRIQTEAAVRRFPVPNTRALGPRFAPGYLLFLSSKGGGDGLWKLENGSARELWKGSEGGVVAPATISPDGSQICFSYRKQGRAGLYWMNADGTGMRALAESFDVRGAASWSPDGKWVAVAANQGEGMRVFKVPVDGGPPVRLLEALSYNPVWSPDGKFIVYSEQQGGGQLSVKAITPDKVPVPIPDIQVRMTTATAYRFVPHRKTLIYLKPAGNFGEQNFFGVDLETGQQRQLTDLKPGFLIRSFDVTPDGKQILFDRLRENSDIVVMDLAR